MKRRPSVYLTAVVIRLAATTIAVTVVYYDIHVTLNFM